MNRILLAGATGAFVLFSACSTKERDFHASGTGGGGSGASSSPSSASSGSGGSGGGTVDPAAACAAYADAVCTDYENCLPVARDSLYGTPTTCVDRFTLFCSFVLAAGGTSWTPARVAACANAFETIACPDFITAVSDGGPGPCLPTPGSLTDGSPCAEAGQCQSTYCKGDGSGLCGTCTSLAGLGAACSASADCQSGLACGSSVCVLEGALGDPCAPGSPCAQPLICKNGNCAAPTEEGSPCNPTALPECFFLKGLYCDPQASICVKTPIAGSNQACGFVGNQFIVCGDAGFCNAPPGGMGICIAVAPDGGACDPVQGPGCALPAVCFQGVCTLPDAAMCM